MLAWTLRLLGIGLITFIMMEAGARWILGLHPMTIDSTVWQHDARRGWIQKPGASEVFVRLAFAQEVEINSLGLREREIPYEKQAGVQRILVIGDSAVVGFEVPPEDVFTRVMERELRERGYPVEVVNAGCRGYGTDQSLLFLMDEGMKYDPDVVLYYWNNNDPDNNSTVHKAFRRFGKSYFHLDPDGVLELRGVPVPLFAQTDSVRLDESGEPRRVEISFGTRLRLWLRDNIAGRSALGGAVLHALALAPQLMEPIRALGSTADLAPKLKLDRDAYFFRLAAALVGEMRTSAERGGAQFAMIGADGRWGRLLRQELGLIDLEGFSRFRKSVPEGAVIRIPYDPHFNSLGHEYYGRALVEGLLEAQLVTR